MKTSYKKHVRTTLKAIGGKRRRNTRRFVRKTYRKFYGGKKLRGGGTKRKRDNRGNNSNNNSIINVLETGDLDNHVTRALGVRNINRFPLSIPNGVPNHTVPLELTGLDEEHPLLLHTSRYPKLGEPLTKSYEKILKNAERIAADNELERKKIYTSKRKRCKPSRYGYS